MNERKIIISFAFIGLAVAAVSLLWTQSFLLTAVLIFLAFLAQKVSPIKKAFVWFVIVSILGPSMESLMIGLGNHPWTYTTPLIFNVPLWLFPLYGLAGIVLAILYEGVIGKTKPRSK